MAAKKKQPLKLQIDMVPATSWGKNLRKSIPKSRWNKIKEQAHDRNGRKCHICGSTEKLHCHEMWDFDDESKTQRLAGLGTVCNMCHHAMHMGRSLQLALTDHLDMNAVVDHFLKVNQCTQKTFEQHRREAAALFNERSNHEWRIDFGEYEAIVQEYAS